MISRKIPSLFSILTSIVLASCGSISPVDVDKSDELKQDIRPGMTKAEVTEILGTPTGNKLSQPVRHDSRNAIRDEEQSYAARIGNVALCGIQQQQHANAPSTTRGHSNRRSTDDEKANRAAWFPDHQAHHLF